MKIGTSKVKLKSRECISVHLPSGYKKKLGRIAFDQDRSISSVVRRMIDKLLEENENAKRK